MPSRPIDRFRAMNASFRVKILWCQQFLVLDETAYICNYFTRNRLGEFHLITGKIVVKDEFAPDGLLVSFKET
jgi:hypothetical protein